MAETSATSTDSGATNDAHLPPSDDQNQTGSGDVASSEQSNDAALQKVLGKDEDDPEVEIFGQKLKKSQWEETRKTAERAKEIERGSRKKFEETAEARKQLAEAQKKHQNDLAVLERIANGFKENPDALFEHFGVKADEWAEQRLTKSLKRAQMTPEQLQQEADMAELQRLRDFEKQTKQQNEQQAHEQLTRQWVQQYDAQIGAALGKSGLPRSHKTVSRMVDIMTAHQEAGLPVDAEVAAQLVASELKTDVGGTLQDLAKTNPKALIDMLGPEVIKAVTDARVATVVGNGTAPPKSNVTPINQQKPKEAPPTFEDVKKKYGFKF